jgi:hypothetical protein
MIRTRRLSWMEYMANTGSRDMQTVWWGPKAKKPPERPKYREGDNIKMNHK